MSKAIVAPKKLIEVALPLEEINKAAGREKSIRHGHPSTLHLWWARRPLAAARAVLFAQLVNDPSWKYTEEELKKPGVRGAVTRKRNQLFRLLTQLVQWESTNDKEILDRARAEIAASWRETCEANRGHPDARRLFDPDVLPAFHDPFAGGGAIPLEAQRLGLTAHATDLNPLPVLINKAMIEIPPRFNGWAPVGPTSGSKQTRAMVTEDWSGSRGLAADVSRYGAWIHEQAIKRLERLYPSVTVTQQMVKKRPDLRRYVGRDLGVIAWIWARTVASPNPAAKGAHTPLLASNWVSTKKGSETWAEVVVDHAKRNFAFVLRRDKKGADPDGTVDRSGARCAFTQSAIPLKYIREEGKAGRLGMRLMAIVAEGDRERVYLDPFPEHEALARDVQRPKGAPDAAMPPQALGFRVQEYGMTRFRDLFTARQLTALTTFSELIGEAHSSVLAAASKSRQVEDEAPLEQGGRGARAYADAVALYLAFVLSKVADGGSVLCRWMTQRDSLFNTFSKHALPMVWNFAEVNVLADCTRSWTESLKWTVESVEGVSPLPGAPVGQAYQESATAPEPGRRGTATIVSTDPPYYDNIGYSDLSDFFYVWIRKSVGRFMPESCRTIVTPKDEELIASPFRHESRDAAEQFFDRGMRAAMTAILNDSHSALPFSVYYAFKETEGDADSSMSTGWEKFLQAAIDAGVVIVGTWPIRTERDSRSISIGTNALASSIVLVCRGRPADAKTISRREFLRELDKILPAALAEMTSDPFAMIAPVDLAQAAIGPGMAIFSQFAAVLEADGSPMKVSAALVHVNKAIDAYFAHAEGDLDSDTRFSIGWFQQYGFEAGPFGEADVLARAKGTSVDGVADAGVVVSGKGKVRLLATKEYRLDWDPDGDHRVPVWQACHQLCRMLQQSEADAGRLLAKMPQKQDAIRQLAYRLYTLCERSGWAENALSYNALIASWKAIVEASERAGVRGEQLGLV